MTVIRPNSISGVTSITAQGGDINVFRADGTAGDLTINNIVGAAATFTGVLSYEDVTNIDSVGVITARSGIRIGATGANTLITGNGTGIGIGITTPTEELHIRAATPVIRLEDGDNARQSQIVGSDGNLRLDADNNNAIANTNIAFRTDGVERLRIASDGVVTGRGELRLTEGTSDVSQGAEIGSLMFLNPANDNKNAKIAALRTTGTSGADLAFYTRTHGDATNSDGGEERLRIDSAGNVGVGTNVGSDSSGNAKAFTIARTGSNGQLRFILKNEGTGFGNGAGYHQGIDGGHVFIENRTSGGHFDFNTNNSGSITSKVRLLADGGLLINSPTGARAVVGTEYLSVHGGSNSNTVGIAAGVSHNNGIPYFASNGSNTTSQRLMRFAAGSGGDTRGTITWNGSNIVYGGSSDYRLKKNVTSLTDGITKLKQLKPITFDWIKETDNNNVMGFLAHEVKEVIPQVVTGEKDEVDSEGKPEYQELDYGGMTPLIVAALQEALSEIETLKARITNLEGN